MTRPDEATLMAYADGELSPEEAKAVEAFLAGSPEDRERVEAMRKMRARLQSAYGAIAEEPVPERLARLLESAAPPVVDLAEMRAARARPHPRQWGAPQFSAMAASLAAGFVVAASIFANPPSGLVVERGGALLASSALDKALTQQAAADQTEIRIGVTFRDADGAWCRTFGAEGLAGLACRAEGGWSVKSLTAPATAEDASDYRLAASPLDPAILAAVEARIEGEPLDADEERAAIDAGWEK